MNFHCSNCGSKRLEEIMCDVTVSYEVTHVGEGGALIYGLEVTEGGHVVGYHCLECAEPVTDGEGDTIDDPEELYKHLNHPLKQLADCASNNEK